MKNFLKENWFKVSMIIAVIILSFVLYKGMITDKEDKAKLALKESNTAENLKLSMQCRTDGEKKFQEDKDEATRDRFKPENVDCYYFDPSYVFNNNLNTCLYSGGYTCDLKNIYYKESIFKGENAKTWTRHIVDVYTNKELASLWIEDSSNVSDLLQKRINDFWDESKILGF